MKVKIIDLAVFILQTFYKSEDQGIFLEFTYRGFIFPGVDLECQSQAIHFSSLNIHSNPVSAPHTAIQVEWYELKNEESQPRQDLKFQRDFLWHLFKGGHENNRHLLGDRPRLRADSCHQNHGTLPSLCSSFSL